MRLPLFLACMIITLSAWSQNFYLFAGTYTDGGSKGIYVYRFNAQSGKMTPVGSTDSATNPSFIILSRNGHYLYAVSETNGANPGKVSAFSFDGNSGRLRLLNTVFSGGDDPCHLSLSHDGNWLMVANYTGGSLSAFPVNPNGTLQPYAQLIQDSGSSVNKERQEKAHVHEAVFSPDNNFVFTPDLGADKVMVYKFNAAVANPLRPFTPPYVTTVPGNGPRHITFSPNKKFAYLVNELSGSVTVYAYNNGKFSALQEIITHPKGYTGTPGSAEIVVSPNGRFLYASNRGDENTITIFAINSVTGTLKLSGYQSTLGKAPRNFIIDPTGNYLLAANQETNNIVIFKVNKTTGLLQPLKEQVHVSKPVCLQLLAAGK
jgi:6-phosphogluconolactonase